VLGRADVVALARGVLDAGVLVLGADALLVVERVLALVLEGVVLERLRAHALEGAELALEDELGAAVLPAVSDSVGVLGELAVRGVDGTGSAGTSSTDIASTCAIACCVAVS